MAIVTDPHRLLGRWLKDHAHASQAHKVQRIDQGVILCYCGRMIKCCDAVQPVQSVLCCPDCTGKWRLQMEEKRKRFNTKGTKYTKVRERR